MHFSGYGWTEHDSNVGYAIIEFVAKAQIEVLTAIRIQVADFCTDVAGHNVSEDLTASTATRRHDSERYT
jgi:hypothetical protein